MIVVVEFAVDVLFGAFFLWLAMLAISRWWAGMPPGGVYCTFLEILGVTAATALVALIPGILGTLLALVTLFWLLMYVTEAGFLEVLLMVVVSRIAAGIAVLLLLSILA